jgi:hypothetical protein
MKSYYLMLRAYGDSVISLGLLDKLPPGVGVVILGSQLSAEVARALSLTRFPIHQLVGNVAAFFDLKRAGPLNALMDLGLVRRALRDRLRAGDRLIFEHADWRNAAIAPPRIVRVVPQTGGSVYVDRHNMLCRLFGDLPALDQCRRASIPVRRVLLHPGARQRYKRLPSSFVHRIVACAHRCGIDVCLVDPEAAHPDIAWRVSRYLVRTSIDEVVETLGGVDLYVGADSFFLHVAYHIGKPMFAIVPSANKYFIPPGLAETGGMLTFGEAAQPGRLEHALGALCGMTA